MKLISCEQRLFRGYEFLSVGMNFISWLRTIFRGNDFYFINIARIKKNIPSSHRKLARNAEKVNDLLGL